MIAITNSLPASCHSGNTALVHFDGQPRIYIACVASYNNDRSHGVWVDPTLEVEEILQQISLMLLKSPESDAEDYAIYGYEGFYSLKIEEHASIADIHEQALFTLEHGELGAKLITYYGGSVEDAEEALAEHYQGEYKSELDYATAFFDECYLETVPASVRSYIDYDSFKIDLFIDDCFSIEVGSKSHIFVRH